MGQTGCTTYTKSPQTTYNRPDHEQQDCYHHAPTVKPEAATAVVELYINVK
jgi:hypothetical protein